MTMQNKWPTFHGQVTGHDDASRGRRSFPCFHPASFRRFCEKSPLTDPHSIPIQLFVDPVALLALTLLGFPWSRDTVDDIDPALPS